MKKRSKIRKQALRRVLFNEAWSKWEKTGENLQSIVDGLAEKYYASEPSEEDLAVIWERLEMMRIIFENKF